MIRGSTTAGGDDGAVTRLESCGWKAGWSTGRARRSRVQGVTIAATSSLLCKASRYVPTEGPPSPADTSSSPHGRREKASRFLPRLHPIQCVSALTEVLSYIYLCRRSRPKSAALAEALASLLPPIHSSLLGLSVPRSNVYSPCLVSSSCRPNSPSNPPS